MKAQKTSVSIHSEYVFGGIYFRIRNRRNTTKVTFMNNGLENLFNRENLLSIWGILEHGKYNKNDYLIIKETKKFGLCMAISKKTKSFNIDKFGYRSIAIPVFSNEEKIATMIENIMNASALVSSSIMNDVEAELHSNSMVLSSEQTTMSVPLYKLASAINEEKDDYYILSKFNDWYNLIPIKYKSISEIINNLQDQIIISQNQLEENILPPVEFFDISIPRPSVA